MAFWLWKAGEAVVIHPWTARPFALQIAGDWQTAAAEWERLGCPYEQARALADGDTQAKIAALRIFEQLGAQPAADRLDPLRGTAAQLVVRTVDARKPARHH
jgi:hypothetical protein